MAYFRPRSRPAAAIPTATMADIAFLLMVFFLVSTTLDVDSGISMVLPPKLGADQAPPPVPAEDLLVVQVEADGSLVLAGQAATLDQVRTAVRAHLERRGAAAVISLKTDRQTPYRAYIAVLDEVWMGYFDRWDVFARQHGYPDYQSYRAQLPADQPDAIREALKPRISIAEPEATGR